MLIYKLKYKLVGVNFIENLVNYADDINVQHNFVICQVNENVKSFSTTF